MKAKGSFGTTVALVLRQDAQGIDLVEEAPEEPGPSRSGLLNSVVAGGGRKAPEATSEAALGGSNQETASQPLPNENSERR